MDTHSPATAVAVFEDQAHADEAVHELERAGFHSQWISVVTQNRNVVTATKTTKRSSIMSPVKEGAIFGAWLGGALGAVVGVSIMVGIIPMARMTVVTNALVLMPTLIVIGLVLGSLVGALVGAGQPEQEARFYGEEMEAGHPVTIVNVHGRYEEAMGILHRHGGHDRAESTVEPEEL
jgi:hypothetical protein